MGRRLEKLGEFELDEKLAISQDAGQRKITPTITTSLVSSQDDVTDPNSSSEKRSFKWTSASTRACLFAAIAYVAMIAVDVWAYRHFDLEKGSATLSEDECPKVKMTSTGLHWAMNIVSTLLLGGSTFAMQCLCAPTRRQVDEAHSRRQTLDIGIQSLHNLGFLGHWRRFLWAVLGFASILIHLSYNSIFFVSSQSYQYGVALVSTQEFQTVSRAKANFEVASDLYSCNNTSPDLFEPIGTALYNTDTFANKTGCPIADLLNEVTDPTSKLQKLSPRECAYQYGMGLAADVANVVLLTADNTSQGVGWAQWPQRTIKEGKTNPYINAWVCRDAVTDVDHTRCSAKLAMEHLHAGPWSVNGYKVEQCLVQTVPSACKLKFNVWIMLGVCAFMTVTLIGTISATIACRDGDALRTIGDAVASFLTIPDHTTSNMSMANSEDFRVYSQTGMRPAGRNPTRARLRWYQTVSKRRWVGTHLLNGGYILCLLVALYFAYTGARGSALANGLGDVNVQSLASVTDEDVGSSSLVPTVLVANLPQLGYTLVHLCNNGLLTKLLLNLEWRRYATEHKGLRVSGVARSEQRDTHFLTMPYRYSIPNLLYSATVYWLLSQSIFLVQVETLDVHGQIVLSDSITRLGYSCKALIVTIGVLVAGQGLLFWLGSWRLQGVGMPTNECHSLVVSAACHARTGEHGSHRERVQWGEIHSYSVAGREELCDADDVRHCAFSGREVLPPDVNRTYL